MNELNKLIGDFNVDDIVELKRNVGDSYQDINNIWIDIIKEYTLNILENKKNLNKDFILNSEEYIIGKGKMLYEQYYNNLIGW